jgi:hypothetical protein
MTSYIFNGGHMQFSLKKSIIWVFIFTALSFAMSVYSGNHTAASVSAVAMSAQHDQRPVKFENISIDYSRAHVELMKKPDEVVVSSF